MHFKSCLFICPPLNSCAFPQYFPQTVAITTRKSKHKDKIKMWHCVTSNLNTLKMHHGLNTVSILINGWQNSCWLQSTELDWKALNSRLVFFYGEWGFIPPVPALRSCDLGDMVRAVTDEDWGKQIQQNLMQLHRPWFSWIITGVPLWMWQLVHKHGFQRKNHKWLTHAITKCHLPQTGQNTAHCP